MTAQPISQLPMNPSVPRFEGADVAGTRMRVSGLAVVDVTGLNGEDIVVTTDDRVRMVGEFRVVAVRHSVDEKTGDLVREHVLKPTHMEMCPWDPSDSTDDGVLRARPRP